MIVRLYRKVRFADYASNVVRDAAAREARDPSHPDLFAYA